MTIQNLFDSLVQAWESGDGPSWGSHFSSDATFVDVLGRVQDGSVTIATEHQKIFDTIYKDSKLKITVLHRRELPGNLEIVVTFMVLSVPEGPRAGDFKCVQTFVVEGDKIIAFQNTGLTDMADFSKHDKDLESRDPMQTRKDASEYRK